MRINDKEKDYYDYLVYQYGVDEKIYYDRTAVVETEYSSDVFIEFWKDVKWRRKYEDCKFLLVFNELRLVKPIHGELYKDTEYHLLPKETVDDNRGWFFDKFSTWKSDTKLADNIGMPIAMYEMGSFIETGGFRDKWYAPKLKNIKGFAAEYPAEQLYQELSLWFGARNSCEPPITVSNDVKIQQAGFDLKQSFRHRK